MPKSASTSTRKSTRTSTRTSSHKYTKRNKAKGGRRYITHPTLRKAQTVFSDTPLGDSKHNRQGIGLILKMDYELMGDAVTYYRFEATVRDNNTKKVFVGFWEGWEGNDYFPWGDFGNVAPHMYWKQISV